MLERVLVVEDEDIIRRGLICSVDWHRLSCGTVSEARNGQEALELIQTGEFDIVLIDINIPMISGLDVLEQTCQEFGYVPILITGYSDFDFARRALNYGAVDYLIKPIDIGELQMSISKAREERDRRRTYVRYQKGEFPFQSSTKNIIPRREPESEMSGVVIKMLDYIEKNFSQKITLFKLSQALFYSETFMIRCFKKEMGIHFAEYLNRYRIQCAITILRTSDMRLSDISTVCGFCDYKYFNNVFKKYIGCSAKEFLRQMTVK